jgi:hypothetical protein
MATIVTRSGKGSALTFAEGDANFTNLNNDKIELTDISVGAEGAASGDGSISYNNTTGVFTFTPADTSGLAALTNISVGAEGAASGGGSLSYNNTTGVFTFSPADTDSFGTLSNVVEDTTPQLGGNLDGQANTVSNIQLKDYKETNFALSYGATITPNVANGNVQTVTLTGNVTFSAFASPEAGQSMTLIIKQDATGSRTLTSTMLFAGADKTLSTDANAIDIMSVFYDGTNYYASLAKGFA